MNRYRLVVVDDHALFRRGLVGLLGDMTEFEVIGEAGDGIEALEALKRKNYDLIFMDIQMPLMNGYEATKIIVEHRKVERPLIIAMTANAMAGDREKCLETGMDDYISKPMKIEVLIHVIQFWGEKKFPKQ